MDLQAYVNHLGQCARRAAQRLVTLDGATKVAALRKMAVALHEGTAALLEANAKDVAAAQDAKLAPALVERLKLSEKRVAGMAESVEQIAAQTDPVGQTLEAYN